MDAFLAACAAGDTARMRELLAREPDLARAVAPGREHGGWTALHEAARSGQADALGLLLAHGANPNAREEGDNTTPLHWAAARGDFPMMRALLDAGADIHGLGADHAGDVIGWGTCFTGEGKDVRAVADFLVARGARHSIFSALSVGDLDLIRAVLKESPDAINGHLSRHEQGVTPLHFAVREQRDDILDLLIARGADLEAHDIHGQTALARAIAMGNERAARRLEAAGARPPATIGGPDFRERVAALSASVTGMTPMILVPDVAAAIAWYTSIGFAEAGRVGEGGVVNWGMVQFGDARIMLSMNGRKALQPVSLWIYTTDVDALYALFKARQLAAPDEIDLFQDVYDPPYGGREFGVRDPNGYELFFRHG